LVSIPGTVEDQEDVLPVNVNDDNKVEDNIDKIDNIDSNVLETTVEESADHVTETIPFVATTPHSLLSKRERFRSALPQIFLLKPNDELDTSILKMAIPNMINLGVVPIVNSVDTFWVGRLGVALALAGQAAANQASFTLFFLIAFLPTITAPLVATAVASGNQKEAQQRVCESLFLCQVLGFAGTAALVCFPRQILSALVLPAGAPAMEYAAPYLRWRALGMVPALISATGFAAYRGMLVC
jgi:Na+-driven multidrug efflux pump